MAIDKWTIDEDESQYKLSAESATKCVKELLSFYKIRVDKIDNNDIKSSFSQALEHLQEAYRLGVLENKRNEDGGFEVVQTVKDGKETITYRELVAKDKRVMDNYEPRETYQRTQALLGKLSKYGPDVIGNLKGDDMRFSEALAMVFFMV